MAESMFHVADQNKDGQIDFEEVKKLVVVKNSNLAPVYRVSFHFD